MGDHQIFSLGDFRLEGGMVLRNARLAYQIYGRLNQARDNAILLCSWYSGTHTGYEFLIQEGKCFDPAKYCVIAVNLFANGLSSSPSDTPLPMNGPHFPAVGIRDNVRAQHELVQSLGITTLRLVSGYSMGAQQCFQWAVSYSNMVERIAPWCGAARTTPHTHVFIEGFTSALKADAAWNRGAYPHAPETGIRAMARVYAGWGLSQAWYREHLYTRLGHPSVEDFLVAFWEHFFLQCDANNLLSQALTWQTHNVGDSPGFDGDWQKALGTVSAKVMLMPGRTDLYFPPEDNRAEADCLPNVVYRPIPSIWGHLAGIGMNPEDNAFLDAAIQECLAS